MLRYAGYEPRVTELLRRVRGGSSPAARFHSLIRAVDPGMKGAFTVRVAEKFLRERRRRWL